MYSNTYLISHTQRCAEIKSNTHYTKLNGDGGVKIPLEMCKESRVFMFHWTRYEKQCKAMGIPAVKHNYKKPTDNYTDYQWI